MGLIEEIGNGPVCLDTQIFIYFMEENPEYFDMIFPIFEAIDKGNLVAVTSGITLLETLVVPLKQGDFKLAESYERLLTSSSGLVMCELTHEVLKEGAYLRASMGLKAPDALQIAAGKIFDCTVFLTNDRRLPAIAGIRIVQLSDYIK